MHDGAPLRYQSGFGNELATEALARRAAASARTRRSARRSGSTPSSCPAPRSPRRAPRTAARGSTASGRRRCTGRSSAHPTDGRSSARRSTSIATSPNQLRWDPFPLPAAPDRLRRRPGDDRRQRRRRDAERACGDPRVCGNRSMERPLLLRRRRRAADRAAAGRAALAHRARRRSTSRPARSRVVPRGVRFRVELRGRTRARGYVCENYGAPFRLPELGPIGVERARQPARLPDAGCGVRGSRGRRSSWSPSSTGSCGRRRSTIRRSTSSRGTATTRRTNTTSRASTRSARSASTIPIRRSSPC